MLFGPALIDDSDSDPADDNDPSVQDDTIHNGFNQHVPPPPQAPSAIQASPPPLDILLHFHWTFSIFFMELKRKSSGSISTKTSFLISSS